MPECHYNRHVDRRKAGCSGEGLHIGQGNSIVQKASPTGQIVSLSSITFTIWAIDESYCLSL